jgi:3-hydroxyacyl-CoA dehydrogenase
MGRFGQKTGAGYYRYEPGKRIPIPDPEVEALIKEVSASLGIKRREISDQEILKRCIYPLINEGAKILDEGIALRASDIDVVWTSGYGFPAYRGGPMFYGDTVGVAALLEDMQRFHKAEGQRFRPARLLEQLAPQQKRFSDFDKT